jgi:hypothetical protein
MLAKMETNQERTEARIKANNENEYRSNNRVTSVACKHALSSKEAVFSAWSVLRSYLEDNWRYSAVEGSVVEC